MNTVALITLLSILAVPALAQQSGEDDPQRGPLVHTVYFWLNNPDSEEDHQKMLEGLRMIEEIDLIKEGYVGVPFPAEEERGVVDSSYDFSITFIFETREDEQTYQTHPTHLDFIENYSSLWKKVVVYDAVSPAE